MKKFLAMLLALVMALGLVACGGNSGNGNQSSGNDAQNSGDAGSNSGGDAQQPAGGDGEITIALITNTTGDYAQYGIPVHNAAMLYINQLNENGGINGKQIKVLEYDDKADGVETVNALNLAV